MENQQIKRVTEAETKAFMFQNKNGIPILSFSPQACYIRAIGRLKVDKLFKRSHQVFPFDSKRGWKLNNDARKLWREIIEISNQH